MRVLYTDSDGNTHAAYKDVEWFPTPPTEGYSIYTIDEETPANDALCSFLLTSSGLRDEEGDSKYSVENDVLMVKDNWQRRAL